MKLHITNLNGHHISSVAQLSQNRVADLAVSLGFREMGIYGYPSYVDSPSELSARIDGILASLSHGDIVVIQSPSWNEVDFDETFLAKLKNYDIKIAIFIHDVRGIMHKSDAFIMDRTISYYNQADLLIVPSQKMLDRLIEHGLQPKKYLIQGIWDYPMSINLFEPTFKREFNFIGEPSRFVFVDKWNSDLPLNLYSLEEPSNDKVTHKGWLHPNQLSFELSKGGFGLVWASEQEWDYYQLNLSYKLTTYLASKMPVIVRRGISNDKLIEENGLGFVVDSLEEAVDIVSSISEEKYNEIAKNVAKYSELLRGGYVTKKLLLETVNELLTK